MSKRDLLIFLFKWKAAILGLFLVVVAAASILIFLAPPSYTATARVLVERNRPPVLRTVMSPSMDLAEALNTEAEIFLSRSVMERVVDTLKPHERPRQPSRLGDAVRDFKLWLEDAGLLYPQSPRERWIQSLQKGMKVKPSIDSSILRVSFGDEDPAWAQRLVNAALEEYIAQHVRVFSKPGTAQIYLDRLKDIESQLRERRTELAELKYKLRLGAVEDTRRELVRRSGELAGQAEQAQTDLQSLLTRFEPGHREVELARARLARLNAGVEQLRVQVTTLEARQTRIDEMQLAIASLEAAFKDYTTRYDEARLTDMASGSSVNVSAVDNAHLPARPDNSRLFLLVVAAVGGLVLSLLIAVIREYFDRRLADPAAAEEILGLPDLGSVGRLPRRRLRALLRGSP